MLSYLPSAAHISSGSFADAPLSEDQKSGLAEVLSGYDPKGLSQDDARSMVSQISELGIRSGRGLSRALADAGFDAQNLARAARIRRPAPPPDAVVYDIHNRPAVKVLKEVVSSLQGTDEATFKAQLAAKLDAAGIDGTKPVVDFRA